MDYWSEDFDNSDWRVNKFLETELVFDYNDYNEVAAEMHISLVRYEQEIQIASLFLASPDALEVIVVTHWLTE